MELLIKDFAKIKYAEIKCDGITVIAGENNTGKSTIGKALFSLYNSTMNLQDKINNQRKNEIVNILKLNLRNLMIPRSSTNNFLLTTNIEQISQRIIKELLSLDKKLNYINISEVIKKNFEIYGVIKHEYDENEILPNLVKKINDIITLSDEKITLEIISRYFNQVFSQQINNITDDELEAYIRLKIKNTPMELKFSKNMCTEFKTQFNILHNAFYIENPFIIDQLNEFYFGSNKLKDHIIEALSNNNQDIMEGIFETVSAKEKLQEIYIILQNVIDGEITKNSNGNYYFNSKKLNKPISVNNLSTGLKSFVVVKMLLEKGALKERDVLILDEPEIHLHPEWQIYYAELIVLLQKQFNLTVIITTHSPYFLDAIEVFSAKHKISDKVNYYLSEIFDSSTSKVNDVTHSIELIYKKLGQPMQRLENLRNRIKSDVR